MANPSEPRKVGDRQRAKLLSRFEKVFHWLYGGDYEIECRKVSATVARFTHPCCTVYHGNTTGTIRPGELCIVERAKVDGKFGSAYTCQSCIEQAERDTR